PSIELHVATTAAGAQYLFGDPLNEMLFARTTAEAEGRVWSRACGGAVHAGLPPAELPNLEEMFRHVSASLGGPLEGRAATGPNQQRAFPVRELLGLCWPHVRRLFAADFDDFHRQFGPVPTKWWCAIAAHTTARPIIEVKDVLPPATALTILMESAI